MEILEKSKTVTFCDGRVTLPGFMDAQECVKSDKQRSREYRERRSSGSDKTHRDGTVTKSDEKTHNVTHPSRENEKRHDATEIVTDRHSMLSSLSLLSEACTASETGPSQNVTPPITPASREPARHKPHLMDAISTEFTARGKTSQHASPAQWAAGCQTVQQALDQGWYKTAPEAISSFAKAVAQACTRESKPVILAFALQQTSLASPAERPGAHPTFNNYDRSNLP
jgi:hypothetical protein